MRELSAVEIELVAGGAADDIVIVGTRDQTGLMAFNAFAIGSSDNHSAFQDNHSATEQSVSVNVHVADSAHLADAEQAAKNWASALSKIVNAAQQLSPNTAITLADGSTITASQLLSTISQTTFQMTDAQYQGVNGGVGTSDYANHLDSLDYSHFEGAGGYASPNYTDQQGMVGIVLHEVVHLSANGFQNFTNESYYFHRELRDGGQPIYSADFYGSRYGADNERFADISAKDIAQGIGIDISQYESARDLQNGGYIGFQGGATLYANSP